MQNILFGAMIVGFAKGIVVILENGKIIDTIVHGMTTLLSDIPASFVIIAMFILQFLLNFFIPSGWSSINNNAINGTNIRFTAY